MNQLIRDPPRCEVTCFMVLQYGMLAQAHTNTAQHVQYNLAVAVGQAVKFR